MADLKVFGRLIGTVIAVFLAAILWLFLLEEMGMGTWECWIR